MWSLSPAAARRTITSMGGGLASPESPAGWETVIAPEAPRLRRLIARNVPRADLVDDVLQDALVRSYRSWPSYDGSRPAWPWLAGIARRACATAVEAEWRHARRDRLSRQAPTTDTHGGPGSDEHVSQLDRQAALRAAFAELTPRHRRLLFRSEFENIPSAVLAGEEQVGTEALAKALQRARAGLRSRLVSWADAANGAVGFGLFGRLRRRHLRCADHAVTWAQVTPLVVASLPAAMGLLTANGPTVSADALRHAVAVGTARGLDDPLAAVAPTAPMAGRHRPPPFGAGAGRGVSAGASPAGGRSPVLGAATATAAAGPTGTHGGINVNWVADGNGGSFSTAVSVRCAHSEASRAWCTAMGLLPDTGPVGFSGGGGP